MNTATVTPDALAITFASAFETRTRDNGESFYCLRDDAPEWMKDAVHAAHGDMMPNDIRYSMIRRCVDSLTEYESDDWRDIDTEIADSLVDCYTSDLTRWLASHMARVSYCDDAAEEYGVSQDDGSPSGMAHRLMLGQFAEYMEILASIIESITDESENQE